MSDLATPARPPRATALRAATLVFTVLAVGTIIYFGVSAIVTAIRDSSPGAKVTERLVRTGRLVPMELEWRSDWAVESLEEPPWAQKSGAPSLGTVKPLQGLTVVNLWASWCEPCRSELPSLVTLARAVPNATFLLVGYDEDWEAPQAFLREVFRSIPREVLFTRDPVGKAGGDQDPNSYWTRLGATGIPETFFVRNGVVVGKVVGAIDWNHPDVIAYLQFLAGT